MNDPDDMIKADHMKVTMNTPSKASRIAALALWWFIVLGGSVAPVVVYWWKGFEPAVLVGLVIVIFLLFGLIEEEVT